MSENTFTIMITATAAPAQATKEGSVKDAPPSNQATAKSDITPSAKHPGLYVYYHGHATRFGYGSGVTVTLADKKS